MEYANLNKSTLDPEGLLENAPGWVLTSLREEIKTSGAWEKLASAFTDGKGRPVFSSRDLSRFGTIGSPANLLIDEFLKRSVTLKHLCYLLGKAEMNDDIFNVQKPESIQIISQSLDGCCYATFGEKAVISIEVKGFPPPTFLWYKDEEPLLDSNTNILTIHEFGTHHEGIYVCLVEQYIDNTEHVIWSSPVELLLKSAAPSIVTDPCEKHLTEGNELRLYCYAKAYPDPCYSWFKDDYLISKGLNETELIIKDASIVDAGSYKCVVENSEGESESSAALVNIQPKGNSHMIPVIIHHPLLCEENPERSIGQSFSLLCTARCLQNITFTWVVNGQTLEDAVSNQHIITSSVASPDYSSSLFYTVSNDDGTLIRVLCLVRSVDSCQLSNEVKIKVVPSSGPKEYTAGSKWALLVANTSYNVGPLPQLFTPLSDMQLIAKELQYLDFHSLLLTDLNLVEFRNAVKLFASLIKPGDYVVFCYAGHGVFSGVDLLMPIPDEDSAIELETLSSTWVRSTLQINHPALLFIVLDMCRHIHMSNTIQPLEIVKTSSQRNSIVLHATSEGYQSLEDPKTSSVLTSSLVPHLQDDVDVVTLARAVLQDIAHKSQFVRCEQIPKLDVDLCEYRSLKDPSNFINIAQENIWASLIELPRERVCQKMVDGCDLKVKVVCSNGGSTNLVCNRLQIWLHIIMEGIPPKMTLALNVKNDIKLLGMKDKELVYEMTASQRIKEPLVLTIGFVAASESGGVSEEVIHLGLPGIARMRIFDKNQEESPLRIKHCHHNIN